MGEKKRIHERGGQARYQMGKGLKQYKRETRTIRERLKLMREGKLFRCEDCGILQEIRGRCDDCQKRGPVPGWAQGPKDVWR
jgi:hypothetical protein